MARFASHVNTMWRAALATSKPTPASAKKSNFLEVWLILMPELIFANEGPLA
jgi:hypothetical protein